MPQDSQGQGPRTDRQLRTLFPDYWRLDSLVRAEVTELPDAVLDWTSVRWDWAGWSIRQQVSHMASVPLWWLISRWGNQLFGDEPPMSAERYATFDSAEYDRRLDDRVFWEIEDILGALDESIAIARRVLIDITVTRARSIIVQRQLTGQWEMMREVHPDGISENPETGEMTGMDLAATFRHVQFEFYTHIFNVQRSKMALGIAPVVRLPDAGYHTVAGWDSALPGFGEAASDIDRQHFIH
ncbi:MAG: hypothetical protein QF357_09425, partial [Dehalococcoidia bacterium]|nr:hypothetical protein [Dehalococcoidia bacterium]